jgi:hypothetical protein
MASPIVSKVARAAAVALIVELTDLALDRAGLTAGRYRLARKVVKAAAGAAGGMLIAKVLTDSDGER